MPDAPRRVSSLGVLGDCLVDSDRERLSLSRRNRAKSMLLSLLVQTGLLSAAVVLPLLATGIVLLPTSSAPAIPIYGGPRHSSAPPKQPIGHVRTGRVPKFNPNVPIFAPKHLPDQISILDERQAEREEGPPESGCQSCLPGGMQRPPGFLDDFSHRMVPPPPQQEKKGRIRQGGDVQAALLIYRVDPPYPPLARQARIEGTVQLRAIIARDGSMRALEVVSGHPLLMEAAKEAVWKWRYRPTLLNGEPVEVDTHITVTFTLNR